jgi:lipopolysaccharide/colanic/teichoic acid biosynthesis glycosyltransferase
MNRTISRFILCFDIFWLVFALGASYALRYDALLPYTGGFYRLLAIASVGFWIALFNRIQLDCLEGGWRWHLVLSKITIGTSLLMVFVLSFAYLARLYYSRLLLVYFAGLLCAGFLAIRVGAYFFLCQQYKRGRAKRVVLLGSERFTLEFNSKILRHPELLYEVVGTLCTARTCDVKDSIKAESYNLALSSEGVLSAFKERYVSELIVLLDESPGLEFQDFIASCRAQGIAISVLPPGYELYTSQPTLVHIDGFPLVALEQRSVGPAAAVLKRTMDLVISVLLLAPCLMIFAFTAVFMLLKKRSIFRRELRIGKNGCPFWMYRLDVDHGGAQVSNFDTLLLHFSISELPQLWNVLRGEMSLVGPRPESLNRVKTYSEWQQRRLKVKPGITGLAQVNGLRNRHASEDKTRYDLQYILEWTVYMDILLLLRTLGALVKRSLPRNPGPESDSSGQVIEDPTKPIPRHGAVRGIAHADRA